jgi:hypothetical protein
MTKKEKPGNRQQKLFDQASPDQYPPNKREPDTVEELQPIKAPRRKFQVSNGYLLEIDLLARILNVLLDLKDSKKISKDFLEEETGFVERQVETLISMGAAMGLIVPNKQILSPIGRLISQNDIFLEQNGTLEWCHYKGASTYKNLVWYEIFNTMLIEQPSSTIEDWTARLRLELEGKYSNRTLRKGLYEEIRFVVDAYLHQNFAKLELLNQDIDEKFFIRRYTEIDPLIISAMLYDYANLQNTQLIQIMELTEHPGSPAIVFGLEINSLRLQIEKLHDLGWLRYETTHNLDQIRLKKGYSSLEFLSAYYDDRKPLEGKHDLPGEKKA